MRLLVNMGITEMEYIDSLVENLENKGYYLKCIVNKGRMFCNAGREPSTPTLL
jgi:hypothetical protein